MSPFASCYASFCHQRAPPSSCQLPSSQREPFQPEPCHRLRASFLRLWEAFRCDLMTFESWRWKDEDSERGNNVCDVMK